MFFWNKGSLGKFSNLEVLMSYFTGFFFLGEVWLFLRLASDGSGSFSKSIDLVSVKSTCISYLIEI